MLKYLRIAVTALCLTACVLLVALWVRSYYVADAVYGRIPWTTFQCANSQFGELHAIFAQLDMESDWYLVTTPFTTRELAETYQNNPIVQAPNRFAIGLSYPTLYTVLTLPHWLLALLCASLASVPWISSRFSLRTLLIVRSLGRKVA